MLGLTGGEIFVIIFIVAAVLSWSLWLRAGERIALWLAGERDAPTAGSDDRERD